MHLTYTTLTYKFLFQIFATADDFFLKKSLIHRENELPTMPSHLFNFLILIFLLSTQNLCIWDMFLEPTCSGGGTLILQSFFVPCASHHLSQLFSLNPSMKKGLVRKIVISQWRPVISSWLHVRYLRLRNISHYVCQLPRCWFCWSSSIPLVLPLSYPTVSPSIAATEVCCYDMANPVLEFSWYLSWIWTFIYI
jgi:hypothetical protein